MSVFKMAWRNLWRNRRRTLVTLSAMTLALTAMILYLGLVAGFLKGMERNILDLELGDIQVFAKGYRDKPSLYTRIEDADALVKKIHAAGFRASARLLAGGLAAAGDSSAGVSLRGVQIAHDASVSLVHKQVDKGAWLDPKDPKGVVVGRRLARTLGVKPGDELVVLTQGADGSMANELYRVRGVLRSIGDAVDRSGVYMTQQTFRELFVLSESSGAHQIVVRRPEQMSLDTAAARLRALVSATTPDRKLEVKTWRQLMPMIASYLDQARGMIGVFVFIVFIAIGIVILNAMLMAVFERIREFGVLKALGMGPGSVLRLILMESIYLTGLAVIFGSILSVMPLWYMARVGLNLSSLGDLTIQGLAWDPVWRASVDATIYSQPIIMMVCVVLVGVLYPAIKAAMIRPVSAMQHR